MVKIESSILIYKPEMVRWFEYLFFKPFEISIEDILVIGVQLKLALDEEVWYYVLILKDGNVRYIEGSDGFSKQNIYSVLKQSIDFDLDIAKYTWSDYEIYRSLVLFPRLVEGIPLFVVRKGMFGRFISRTLFILGIPRFSNEVKTIIRHSSRPTDN